MRILRCILALKVRQLRNGACILHLDETSSRPRSDAQDRACRLHIEAALDVQQEKAATAEHALDIDRCG